MPRLHAEARLQQDIQAAKMIIVIVFAFLLCYIPPLLITAWARSSFYSIDIAWRGHLVHTSILISSEINPVIYCFRTRRFRCALKQFLNDPCGKTAFQEIKQEQRAREIIPNRNARGENITREPDQERFELSSTCSPLFQWVRNSNCCNGRMGQIVQQFEQKKSRENIDEKLGRQAARNKVIPFTIQEKPQAQIISPPMDNENYTGKLPRRERPTPYADYSRQEVIVEVHPKRNHGPPKEKVAETPTSKDNLAPPITHYY